ncbi:MAG: 50S ribosomal protein L21 [delta proteobacterium ML8_F1]|nr:MAG: 50S ribosomal protein L21 [delta proteobacterium ML8_F1]
MYAIIETGGKQYRVEEGDTIFIEKVAVDDGEAVEFEKVLMVSGDEGLKMGRPYIENAKVEGTVLKTGKQKKVIIFKYKAKKDYRKKQGHRQPFTQVKIDKITL